jgi:type IV secretory pathway TrbD component
MASNTTYGDYIRTIPKGLAGIGRPLTFAGFGVFVASIILMSLSWVAGLATLIVGVGAIMILAVRDRQHRNIADRMAERRAYRAAVRSGRNLYRGGMLGLVDEGATPLPGVLSHVQLVEALDGAGRPFALLRHRHTGEYTLPLRCHPQGASLVDDDVEDAYVSGWAAFLEAMARTPGVAQVNATVDTSPDSGTRIRGILRRRVVAGPDELAGAAMGQVMRMLSQGGSRNDVTIQIDFRYVDSHGRPLPEEQAARQISTLIPSIAAQLAEAGGGAADLMSADQLAVIARTSYAPDMIEAYETRDPQQPVPWRDCGPAACEAAWDYLRHDSALSRTWQMCDPPKSLVTADTLASLLGPLGECDRKRVTITFKLLDSAKSRFVSEDNRKDSKSAQGQQKHVSVATLDTQYRADRQASDVNEGASLAWFGLLVTATVLDRDGEGMDRLEKASRAVETAAGAASLDLRVCYAAQDSAFAAALPFGIDVAACKPPSPFASFVK